MIGIIKYDLIEERKEFEVAFKASNYKSALWDIDQYLRSELKYSELSEEEYKAFSRIRKKVWDIASDNEVQIDL